MTVFETLVLMIAFATLIVAVLSEQKKVTTHKRLASNWVGYFSNLIYL